MATLSAGSGPTSSVWSVDLPNLEPYPPTDGYNRILITVESSDPTSYAPDLPDPPAFAYPDAPLAAFTWVQVPIGDGPEMTVVVPNGGEEWSIGEEYDIEWTAPPSVTDVKIEYSKDVFSTDINEIVASTPNVGVFTWEIPDDPTGNVRVRVSEVDNPDNNDISDEDFSIILSDCTPVFTEK